MRIRRPLGLAHCLALALAFGLAADGALASEPEQGPAAQASASLLEAAFAGRIDRVREAIERGADCNARGADGRTALMLAAFDGHTKVARLLLEHGAQVNALDPDGRTALMYAASGPNRETVEFLLEHEADPLLADRAEHFTALMFAAAEGQTEVVRLLLGHGSDPAMVDVDGDTALDFALQSRHSAAAEILKTRAEQN